MTIVVYHLNWESIYGLTAGWFDKSFEANVWSSVRGGISNLNPDFSGEWWRNRGFRCSLIITPIAGEERATKISKEAEMEVRAEICTICFFAGS